MCIISITDCPYDIALVVDQSQSMTQQSSSDGTTIQGEDAWFFVVKMVEQLFSTLWQNLGLENAHMALVTFSHM